MARRKPDAIYRSGYERKVANYLTNLGISFGYETAEIPYRSPKRGALCLKCDSTDIGVRRTYIPDFALRINASVSSLHFLRYIEAKGRFTASDRSKMLDIKRTHPTLDLRILFESDNWMTKAHLMRYSDWAERHGFPFAVSKLGRVPESWLEDVIAYDA